MLREIRPLLVTLASLCCATGALYAAEDETISLFNGQDLDGWRGDPQVWSVEDGALVGRNTADDPVQQNTFLIWEGEVSDFELQLEYRIHGGNSGIQYRSRVVDEEKWSVGGYQADIDAERTYAGILYEEQGRGILALRGERVTIKRNGERKKETFGTADELKEAIHDDDWNQYVVTARGNRLRHEINGELMSETIDRERGKRRGSGVLALQVHAGPPMVVQFRNLRLRQLQDVEAAQPEAAATPTDALSVADGFRAELLYSVPRAEQGSWVALTVDPQGRIIASNQYGRLYRITPAPIGKPAGQTRVEPLPVSLEGAHGLAWVGDSLYVVCNEARDDGFESGLYRARDSNGDGQLNEVKLLRRIDGGGEHGPHAVIPSPDGKSLYVVGGNHTQIPEPEDSLVPRIWGEDQLLPRLWDASGHAVGILAPAGWICRTDLQGQRWELVSCGYRNAYDIAFNQAGDLFTYDADMEWDIGAPWYRPTRVCHVASGGDFGWRSGTGKFPAYYPDSLPALVDIGPGSPTGITFGYQTQFPSKYQNALYICDWSFGKIYAVHLDPNGATYRGTLEDFVSGAPLPLTDIVVNPHDGALYFAIGGRKTQSGLYRVTATGATTANGESRASDQPTAAAVRRRQLETWHGREDPAAVEAAWPHLDDPDRFVRHAARVAIEWQPVAQWQQQALTEQRTWALIEALVALARKGDPQDSQLPSKMVTALEGLSWDRLSRPQQLAMLRVVSLMLIRLDGSDSAVRQTLLKRLDPLYPSDSTELNAQLSQLLVYLEAPRIVERTLELMDAAATQEEQIHYAYALRPALADAPIEIARRYFDWFAHTGDVRGGHSLRGFLSNIRDSAAKGLSAEQRDTLADELAVNLMDDKSLPDLSHRPVVKEYSVSDVLTILATAGAALDHREGRRLFATALCFKCHRVGNDGGNTGPDLTTVGRRFSRHDLVQSIVEPNKAISDRFRATAFMMQDGRVVTGRVANLSGENLHVVTNMLAPGDFTVLARDEIDEMRRVDKSEMPAGLLNSFDADEIRQLFAYLLDEPDVAHTASTKRN